jgi:hypothetical protein
MHRPPKPRGPAAFDALLPIADRTLPFQASDGRGFVRLRADSFGGFLYYPVRSRLFREWFDASAFADYTVIPTTRAFSDICRHLEAQGSRDPGTRGVPVFRRVASTGEPEAPLIRIDLSNSDGEFIEVSSTGWRVAKGPGTAFETSCATRPLPAPEKPAGDDPDPFDFLRSLFHLGAPDSQAWTNIFPGSSPSPAIPGFSPSITSHAFRHLFPTPSAASPAAPVSLFATRAAPSRCSNSSSAPSCSPLPTPGPRPPISPTGL